MRCVAVEQRFVVYSPYEPARTQRYVTAAERAFDDLEQGLGVAPGPPVVVALLARSVEGGEFALSGDELTFESLPVRPSECGLLGLAGRAGDRAAVNVYVAADSVLELPDGRAIAQSFTFPEDLGTLRHELAHVVAARAGLGGPQWLDEGLAQLFEYGRLENGELSTDRDAPSLVAARESWAETTLNLLVAWEETHADVVAGRVFHAGRPLAHALAVYVVERGTGSVPERVRRLAALEGADVQALEPGFRAWLAAGLPRPAAER